MVAKLGDDGMSRLDDHMQIVNCPFLVTLRHLLTYLGCAYSHCLQLAQYITTSYFLHIYTKSDDDGMSQLDGQA
jgi:hypothetical protein